MAAHKRKHRRGHSRRHWPGEEGCFADHSRTHQTCSVSTQTLLTVLSHRPSVPNHNPAAAADCSSSSPPIEVQPERERISEEENREPIESSGRGTDRIREIGDEVTSVHQRAEAEVQRGSDTRVLTCLVGFLTGLAVMYLYKH